MLPYIICLALLFSFLGSFSVVEGYKIDQSCRKAGIYDEVEEALQLAFRMAQSGMDALERSQVRDQMDPPDAERLDNPSDEVPPRPSQLQDLIKNLFAHDDIINESQDLPDVPEHPLLPYKQTMKKIKLTAAYETFRGILRGIRDPGSLDVVDGFSDAIIYCDGSRYEWKNGLWAFDKENRVKRGLHKKQCFSPLDKLMTLAETYASVNNVDNKITPSTIQLCRPLIKAVQQSQKTKSSYLGYKWKQIKSSIEKSAAGKFRQIDIMGNSLPVVLLHEMTHTTVGMTRDDVKVGDGGIFGISKGPAYGWENMKRLAKTLPYVDKADKKACDNNADSLAYFALGCKLMSDSDNPFIITDDGVLQPLNNAVGWTPNSWKRRWLAATGIPIP